MPPKLSSMQLARRSYSTARPWIYSREASIAQHHSVDRRFRRAIRIHSHVFNLNFLPSPMQKWFGMLTCSQIRHSGSCFFMVRMNAQLLPRTSISSMFVHHDRDCRSFEQKFSSSVILVYLVCPSYCVFPSSLYFSRPPVPFIT